MRQQSLRAIRPAVPLAVLATLTLTGAAHAHRLEGEYRVLPDRKVRVEAWFETGDAPKGAKVRVYRADGSPLFSSPGELDARGEYVFAYEKAEKLKVVISAGDGHRKELTIPAAELSGPGPSPASAPRGPEETQARERAREFPFKDLLLGITFLLALGAFVLSLRNARRLRDLPRG
jgi:nickel transport protein